MNIIKFDVNIIIYLVENFKEKNDERNIKFDLLHL
jgi:hypothetical protein